MRDGEELVSGVLLVHAHPFPQVFRVERVEVRERNDRVRVFFSATENDIAVKIISVWVGRPFEADEGSKQPGLVVIFCGLSDT